MEKKREILEEQIKQALTSTYKVVSDKIINNNPKDKTFDFKSLDFSEVKDLKDKADYIKLRANVDSKELKLRFSNNDIYLKNHPKNPALRKIYHLSEIIRCEMLGSKMLKGIKKNLENKFTEILNSVSDEFKIDSTIIANKRDLEFFSHSSHWNIELFSVFGNGTTGNGITFFF